MRNYIVTTLTDIPQLPGAEHSIPFSDTGIH